MKAAQDQHPGVEAPGSPAQASPFAERRAFERPKPKSKLTGFYKRVSSSIEPVLISAPAFVAQERQMLNNLPLASRETTVLQTSAIHRERSLGYGFRGRRIEDWRLQLDP